MFIIIYLWYNDQDEMTEMTYYRHKHLDMQINFLNVLNLSSCSMALGLTQPLAEMNIRKFIWEVKHCRHVKLTISLSSVS
jgi:hypothetical protein